jgi:hypothetical protein
MPQRLFLSIGLCVGLTAFADPASSGAPTHSVPPSASGNVVVGLCDGQTSMEVPGVKDGSKMTRSQAQSVSDALMKQWRAKNPHANWEVARSDVSPASTPAKNEGASASSGAKTVKDQAGAPVQSGDTYAGFSGRDEAIWKASTQQFVDQGNHIFHDAKELGGTVAISCDMCHPNAANTHPETYPKYQVQLGRVALLRDMINWCIENPVRGKPLKDDDPKLKALEAYILAQRKGTPLEYGKH